MNKIKYLFYIIVLVALGVLVYQNREFLIFPRQAIYIDLHYLKMGKFIIPGIPTVLYILGAFAIGYFFAFINGLFLRFQTNRTVKTMRTRMKVQLDELSSLRKEVEFLHRNPARTAPAPSKKEEPKTETKAESAGEIKQAAAQS
jgi:hypothetical protein